MSGLIKVLLIALIIAVIGAVGYSVYNKNLSNSQTVQYAPVYSPSAMTQTSTNSLTNNSDAQLDQDMKSIDTKLNGVDQEQTQVNDGLNQATPSLGQ